MPFQIQPTGVPGTAGFRGKGQTQSGMPDYLGRHNTEDDNHDRYKINIDDILGLAPGGHYLAGQLGAGTDWMNQNGPGIFGKMSRFCSNPGAGQ